MILIFFISDQSPRIFLVLVFAIACLTDYLDGYIARKMNQVSQLGKFLDPVADKLLVITSLLLVLFDYNNLIIFIPICIIVIREVLVSALREWAAISNLKSTFSKGKSLDVNSIGKIKTFIQMLSIGFLLCQLVDEIFNKYLSFPNWYLPLRRILTLIVVIVLICSYFITQTL